MPEPTTEPDKYSIDEMMDRLKKRGSEDDQGELVTRADGSQVVKLKKRKRRSNQAVNSETKRNQRVQMLQIAGFVMILVLFFLVAGVGIIYANSKGYREDLVAKVESASGAKVAFKQFRMNPATANVDRLTMEWPSGNALSKLEMFSAIAKIAPASFLGNVLSGEEVVARKGDIILTAPVAGEASGYGSGSGEKRPIQFSRYSIPQLNVYFGKEKSSSNMLEKTEASFFPSLTAGQGEIRCNGGLLRFKDWPPMALDRFYTKVREKELRIQSMRFTIPTVSDQRDTDKGTIDFTGTLKPLDADTTHRLTANVDSFRLSYLLGADLGRFFIGRVNTNEVSDSNFLNLTPDSVEETLLELTLSHALDSRIDISGFKFLRLLALTLEDGWYELPNFDGDVTMVLQRRGQKVELSGINFEQRGKMVLRGSIKGGEAGKISGTIQVGVPETMIIASENDRLDRMFRPIREGYRWLELEIGGTSALPIDNFKRLYDEAALVEKAEEDSSVSDTPDTFDGLIETD